MKKILKRLSPDPETLKNHKHLGWLSEHLHDTSLWNFNRRSISKAFAVGLFCAFVPVPFQMLLAAPGAVIFSANLPLSVALVWITNPITMPPIYYGCYKLGAWMLGVEVQQDFRLCLGSVWCDLATFLTWLLSRIYCQCFYWLLGRSIYLSI